LFDFIYYGSAKLELFLLLILRASGLLLFSPVIGHQSIPKTAKVGLAILFAIVLMPAMQGVEIPVAESPVELAGMVARELMVGILIGFFFALLIKAAEAAGSLVGFQVGLIIAQAFDPNANDQVAIIGRLWIILATLIFMAINGHHLVILAFSDSYQVIPAGYMQVDGSTAELMMKFTGYVFVLALKFAAPVMITLFLTDVALGTVAKMMPTMNIFVAGFPIKITVGFAVLAMSLPVFSYVLEKTTVLINNAAGGLLASMGKV